MNRKIIRKILKAKVTKWLKHVDDERIQSVIRNNTIITGGAIASFLLGEKVKDYDVYFKTKEAAEEVARYYVDKFNASRPDKPQAELQVIGDRIKIHIQSAGVAGERDDMLEEAFDDVFDVLDESEKKTEPEPEKQPYRPVFLSSNAITLADKVQLVIRFYGEPDQIHENYDFVHATNYWTSWDNHLELRAEALEALMTKELVYVGSKYPLCSVIRTRKFLKRGFHINAGQYLKMMMQVSELDLKDVSVLEEQLIGVDSAYFGMLIEALNRKKEADPNFTVSHQYVASVIDKIF